MGNDTSELERRLREFLPQEAERASPSPVLPRRVSRGVRARAARTVVTAVVVVGLAGFGGFVTVRWLDRSEPAVVAAPSCSWSVAPVPTPATAGYSVLLRSVTAVAGEAWAVGHYGPPRGFMTYSVIERWDGESWHVAPTGDPESYGGTGFTAVAASDSGEVWAVGWDTAEAGDLLLIQRRDESRWTRIPAPDTQFPARHLNAVAAIDDDDVWAVGGWARPGVPEGGTYTLHFDGAEWTEIPSPQGPAVAQSGGPYSGLNGVAAVSEDDVWAVGQSTNVPQTISRNLALHWDGSTWSVVSTPDVEAQAGADRVSNALTAVEAVATDDVWAVGHYEEAGFDVEGAPSYRPLVLHWDGVRWSVVPLPEVAFGQLSGITAVSRDDVWAVGSASADRRVGFAGSRPLLLHWDGEEWSRVPEPDGSSGSLASITATSSRELWAVGDVAGEDDSVAASLALRCS